MTLKAFLWKNSELRSLKGSDIDVSERRTRVKIYGIYVQAVATSVRDASSVNRSKGVQKILLLQ